MTMDHTAPGSAGHPGTADPGPQQQPLPYRVVPPPGSRLEQLRGELEGARAAVKEAEQREAAIRKGIQAEAVPLAPRGTSSVIIAGDPAAGVPDWNCHWVPGGWQVDGKALKAADPVTYVRYGKPTAGYWKIEKAGGR